MKKGKFYYMTLDSKLPVYIPYPEFLKEIDVSNTAKIIYSELLHRATLSQRNGMIDKEGRVYVIYTIQQMSKTIKATGSTVKRCYDQLEKQGLIERHLVKNGLANHIYLCYPKEVLNSMKLTNHPVQNGTSTPIKNGPRPGSKKDPNPGQKWATSNIYSKQNKDIYTYKEGESF